MIFPLERLRGWSPFRLDALGLVTLLGADEVSHSVGRLVRSRWLEYLPLLGAYVIASDQFREKIPGPIFYNIPQGFTTTDLAPWHSRWLRSQDFQSTRTIVRWSVLSPQRHRKDVASGASLGFLMCGTLVVLTVLMKDWWGFANAAAIIAGIAVRTAATTATRNRIDRRIDEMFPYDGHDLDDLDDSFAMLFPQDSGDWNHRADRCLIVTEDTKCVTVIMPYRLLAPPSVFMAKLEPTSRSLYTLIKACGWFSFAVHVIAIGMADLVTQIYTVFLLVIPTVLLSWKFGCEDANWRTKEKIQSLLNEKYRQKRAKGLLDLEDKVPTYQYGCYIGSRLRADVFEFPVAFELEPEYGRMPDGSLRRSEQRIDLYAWLQLTDEEEKSMEKWEFFPHTRGGGGGGGVGVGAGGGVAEGGTIAAGLGAVNTSYFGHRAGRDVRWWKSYLDKKTQIASVVNKLYAEKGIGHDPRGHRSSRTESVAIELGRYSMKSNTKSYEDGHGANGKANGTVTGGDWLGMVHHQQQQQHHHHRLHDSVSPRRAPNFAGIEEE